MTLQVRKADPKEPGATALLQASHALMTSLYPAEHNHYLEIDELCTPDISFLIVEEDGEALGCGAMANKGTYGELKSIFTDPKGRGKGVAALIMSALEAEATAQNLPVIKLETGDTLDAAHRLYARCGFTICEKFGAYDDGPHSVFMEKQLT